MISIEKCNEVLKDSGRKYTDEEIKKIRDLLYQISIIEYENFKSIASDESCNVQKSLHRRTEGERV